MRTSLLLLLLAASAFPQLPDAPSHLSPASPVRPLRAFLLTESTVAATTALDVASTEGALSRGCREVNPLLGSRPSTGRALRRPTQAGPRGVVAPES